MAEGEAARAEQLLGLRTGGAGAEGREERDLVEREEGGGAGEVERDDGAVRPARGVDASDDGRAAAEGDDGDVALGAEAEHRSDFVVVGGRGDRVGRGLRVVQAAAQQVGGALASEMQQPHLVVARHLITAHDLGEGVEVGVRQQ